MSSIVTGDITLKYSTKTGSAGNTLSSTAAESLGKYCSTTAITSAVLYNFFPTLTGDQNAAGGYDYKGVFIHNAHADHTALNVYLWLTSLTSGSTTYTIGLDTIAASAIGASPAQMASIATTAAAPAGVSFTQPTSKAAGLAVGDIPPGYVKGFWIRRKANNTIAVAADNVTFAVDVDTRA